MISFRTVVIFSHLFFLIILSSQAQYKISGFISQDQKIYTRVVLEHIPDIDGLSTVVQKNIINSSSIDVNGYYEFTGVDLPKEKLLYRISVQEPGEGISITDGLNKNFILILAQHTSQIHIAECSEISQGFNDCTISGDRASQLIQTVYENIINPIYLEVATSDNKVSATREEFIMNKLVNDFKHFADTTQSMMAGIVALNLIENIDEEYKLDPIFFENYISKWGNISPTNKYLSQFREKIDVLKFVNSKAPTNTRSYSWISYLLSILLIGALAYIIILRKKIKQLEYVMKDDYKPLNMDVLSKKEKEVVNLLLEGKSNKEIAQTLFIETSTVKTHVSSIFKKLKVSSRPELLKSQFPEA